MKLLKELIALILREHEKLRRLYKAATVLACIVVFVTTYVLMLPAISLDKRTASQQAGLRLDPSGSSVIERAAENGPDGEQTFDTEVPAAEEEPASSEEAAGAEDSDENAQEMMAAASEAESDGDAEDLFGENSARGEEDASSDSGSQDAVSAENEDADAVDDSQEGGNDADLNTDAAEDAEYDVNAAASAEDADAADTDASGTADTDVSGTDVSGAGDTDAADPDASDAAKTDASDAADTDASGAAKTETSGKAKTDAAVTDKNQDAAAAATTAQAALPEEELITEETELTAQGDGYKVYVTVTMESKLPRATEISVREITKEKDEDEFALYFDKAQKDLRSKYDDSVSLSFARFYDITFLYKGARIEPASKVKVRFEFDTDREPEVPGMARVDLIHFLDSGSDMSAAQMLEEPEYAEFIESEWKLDGDEKILTGAGDDLGSQSPFEDEDVYMRDRGVSRGGVSSGADEGGSPAKNRRMMKSARGSASEDEGDGRGLSEFEFGSDAFSVYGVLGTVIEKYIIASDGNSYRISVTYGAEAEVPEGSELGAVEIVRPEEQEESTDGDSLYGEYVSRIEETMGWEAGSVSHVRLFDIRIQDPEGEKVQISAPVDVKIELMGDDSIDLSGEDTRIIHFADGSGTGDVIDDFEVDGDTVSFTADGFSAYAIVEGPPPGGVPDKVMSVQELAENYNYEKGFYLSYGSDSETYFTNTVKKSGSNRVYKETGDLSEASPWFFEPAGDNTYYIYTNTAAGKQYMYNNTAGNANNMDLSADSRTAFVVSKGKDDGKFYLQADGQEKWLQHSNGGGGIRLYTDIKNDTNSQIMIGYVPEEMGDDPYKLDGLTYGLMNWNGGAAGKALMASSSVENNLDAKSLTCMTNQGDDEDKLFVPNNSDITMWTFENESLDQYYLKTVVDGSTMYLKISPSGLSLTPDKEEAGTVQVVPGTGIHAGQIFLQANGATLTYSGSINQGFGVGGSTGSEYLYLTEESTLTEDYFRTYSANKVSVSDPAVTNGSKIIVYTRSWNDKKKRYELYAVKGDGTLVPCYESGDSIEWVGGQFNELLWDFVEYYEEGTSDPTYFYELYNEYTEKFIAPQVTDGQVTSDSPIGINLNGRRDGKYYSNILAWDDNHYAYAGLKVEDGKIVSCPLSETMDFYFATMEELPVDDQIHTVTTVDNGMHGITMKMIDKENDKTINGEMNRILGSNAGGVGTTLQQGLLADHLEENGYPMVTKTEGSLYEMYAGDQEVNHLFIESTYNATGYFEFDSAQNFAHLDGNNFEVYKELGSVDDPSKVSLKHGQFYPYNIIEPGVFAVINGKNQYDAEGHALPDGDPRKNEQLYLIKDPDHYFAMELEAGFIQTPNGLDEWGHDIIYEFTGDDDFWLYVDGELVIDLGGIHSAVAGSVNFRTGEVYVNGKNTTLYDIFKEHYQKRGIPDVEAELDKVFRTKTEGGKTYHVFKDNTSHTMKIFYMERGASASNLHMRFNLASVKPNTFLLGKELTGVNAEETVLAEFPYQIRYRVQDIETGVVEERILENTDSLKNVVYKGTNHGVTFKDELKIHDGEAGDITYEKVFILKPGELAEVSFPLADNEELVDYYVNECGVNKLVYQDVLVNDDSIEGTDIAGHPDRKDYKIPYETTANRPKVDYVNEVNPDALRTVTINKRLFREDGTSPIYYDEDQTAFNFRLYLGTESDEALTLANMHTYHVKNPDGFYCIWKEATQKFEPTPYKNYEDVPDNLKTAISFNTSMNGSISKIPVDHTVELREILVGTQFRVEERANEIPDGYSFQRYEWRNTENVDTSEIIVDKKTRRVALGVNDTVEVGENPDIDVRNLKGWGLRLNKVWSDADYMSDRDPTYFAVFTQDKVTGELTLVEGTVRELPYNAKPQTLYWYFQTLPDSEASFDDYVMREVTLNGHIEVDENGVVTSYHLKDIIDEGGEVDLRGIQKGDKTRDKFTYTVNYLKGDAMDNLRVDTVNNNRPGIVLRKEDWEDNPLSGCTFVLKDDEGLEIGTFTSDEEGLVTVAFLRDKVNYELTETSVPGGFRGLEAPMTIYLKNGTVSISGVDEEYYDLEQGAGMTPTLTIKNRPYTFRAVKVSGKDEEEEPLPGVHFSLHRQITVDEQTSYDIYPMAGYEDIVSDEDGYLPGLDVSLRDGTFELQEMDPVPEGYQKLPSHIHFSKTATGFISLVDPNPEEVTLSEEPLEDGTIEYVLKIRNDRSKKVSFLKVDGADPHEIVLPGAEFDLYRVVEDEEVEPPLYSGLVSGTDGLLKDSSGSTVFTLDNGTYHLVETKAPQGYIKREDPIVVVIGGPTGVSYDDGTAFPLNPGSITYDESTDAYTLLITNSSGATLPESGGPGTGIFRLIGLALTAGSALALAWLAATRKRIR